MKHTCTKYRIGSFASVVGAVSLAALALYFSPSQTTQNKPRVFNDGLSIHLPRTSPAFAAMEDSLLEDRLVASESFASAAASDSTVVEFLESGGASGDTIAKTIVRDNERESSLIAQERAAREQAARMLVEAAGETVEKAATAIAQVLPRSAPQEYTHPTQTIHLSDLGMSREDLVKELLLPIAQNDPAIAAATSGWTGTVASQPAKARALASAPRPMPVDPTDPFQNVVPKNPRTAHNKPNSITQNSLVSEMDALAKREPVHQVVVAGSFEFAGGLALTNGTDRVVVYRENEEQPLESAAVWMREGRYEIFVEETTGILVAELRTPHGDILGRGEIDLAQLPPIAPRQYRVEGVKLKITPVGQGVTGQIISAYSYDRKTFPVPAAKVEFRELPLEAKSHDDGRFEEPSLLDGSSVIVKASRAGHWGTLAVVMAGSSNRVTLYPDKMMRAFFDLSGLARGGVLKDSSVVWGKVTANGQPVAGAKVEILTTQDEVRPVYFNSMMIPDPSLEATSENGLYAFYPVVPGAHAVRASLPGAKVGEPRIFPAESGSVSHVEIEVTAMRQAQVRVFDAFRTDWPLPAVIAPLGGTVRSTKIDATGSGTIRYAAGSGLMFLDASAGQGYERIRLSLNRERRLIYMPMIQTTWMEKVRGAMRANTIPHTGSVVGFIQGKESYQVVMDDEGLLPQSQIVYFDSRGEVVGSERGVPGGGFILLNVPEGFRTVTVQPERSASAFATTVLVEPKATNIINHWIR